jgi:hypothetical protein
LPPPPRPRPSPSQTNAFEPQRSTKDAK